MLRDVLTNFHQNLHDELELYMPSVHPIFHEAMVDILAEIVHAEMPDVANVTSDSSST